jgi:hypothetical protein
MRQRKGRKKKEKENNIYDMVVFVWRGVMVE